MPSGHAALRDSWVYCLTDNCQRVGRSHMRVSNQIEYLLHIELVLQFGREASYMLLFVSEDEMLLLRISTILGREPCLNAHNRLLRHLPELSSLPRYALLRLSGFSMIPLQRPMKESVSQVPRIPIGWHCTVLDLRSLISIVGSNASKGKDSSCELLRNIDHGPGPRLNYIPISALWGWGEHEEQWVAVIRAKLLVEGHM